MKDMMEIMKGAEENRAPGRRSWIVTMAISLVGVGTGAPYYDNDDSDNLNGRGYRCCLFMLIILMAVAFSVGIQVVLITIIYHLRA